MKEHPTLPGLYVTEDGRVFQELGLATDRAGYALCTPSGQSQATRRHVLVCEAFHGPRPEGGVVRHLDGNPGNDTSQNLCWGTQAQNCADTVDHGKSTTGEKNARAKLTAAQVLSLRARWADGESPTALAEDYAVALATVQDAVRRRTWKHI